MDKKAREPKNSMKLKKQEQMLTLSYSRGGKAGLVEDTGLEPSHRVPGASAREK